MGTVYKKTATKPMPQGAEILIRGGQRVARWKDAKGKTRTTPTTIGRDGRERIVVTARTFTAKYRDGQGIVREVATGCRDEGAARNVLADLIKRAERVRAKVLTPAEDAVVDHLALPLEAHFGAYLTYLESCGTSPVHRENVDRCLKRVAAGCRFQTLPDLRRDPLERWLVDRSKDTKPIGARTRNFYRAAIVAFCNWCIGTDRLLVNPFSKVAKADEDADPRRKRRALTEEELARLLIVARMRPLAEYGRTTERVAKQDDKQKRGGWAYVRLRFHELEEATIRARERLKNRPDFIANLEAQGRERSLIYKTLVLTGLRKGELASLTVGQLHWEGPAPYAVLDAADEKNRHGSQIPLRRDLVEDLRIWLVQKARRGQSETGSADGQPSSPTSSKLPLDTRLFEVPDGLIRILDRDLKVAGIPKRDDLGRTVDVHALRHSFGTLLSKGGVAPRTAQAAMRHSSIDLTMNVYTDPRLLDVHGALEALPALPPYSAPHCLGECDGEMVNNDSLSGQFAPKFAPTRCNPGASQTIADLGATESQLWDCKLADAVSACCDKTKQPVTNAVTGCQGERATGFEPATSSLGS
jgi:integrase